MKAYIAVVSTCMLAACLSARAQLALSANDGKQPLLYETPQSPTPDNVAVIDLNHFPPKVIGTVDAPTSMIGPPAAIAVAHDGSFALVSNASKLDPSNPGKFTRDDKVSVIDLKDPRHPAVIQTVQAGAGATGISFNKADTLALVAATGGTVSAFSIAGKRLTLVGTVQLDPKAQPVDAAISPDGKTAFVTQRSANVVVRLAIDGDKVTNTGIAIPTGHQNYGVVFSPDGKFAYNTNLGGRLTAADAEPQEPRTAPRPGGPPRAPRMGTVTVIDVNSNQVVNTVDVGVTPEHLTLSPDGKYLVLTIGNGSSSRPSSPYYHPFGFLKVYSVDGSHLTEVAEAKTGGWGQGATWNKNHTLLLLQSAIDKDIEVYRFNGKSLTRQPATIKFDSRPGSIATAMSR